MRMDCFLCEASGRIRYGSASWYCPRCGGRGSIEVSPMAPPTPSPTPVPEPIPDDEDTVPISVRVNGKTYPNLKAAKEDM